MASRREQGAQDKQQRAEQGERLERPEPAPIEPVNGTVVLQGFGISVRVINGALVCEDGICQERRRATFYKVDRIRRLVLDDVDGYITTAALQWLFDAGVELIVLGRDDAVLAHGVSPGADYPALRRGQALAALHPAGIEFMRELLVAKLDGQAGLLQNRTLLPEQLHEPAAVAAKMIERLAGELRRAPALYERFQALEAQAAQTYWKTLEEFPVRFDRAALAHVPPHWRSLGPRMSPLSDAPAKAATPGQALVNYVYAILRGEVTAACRRAGLDPGVGLMHVDTRKTANLALDLMEPVRVEADRLVLDLLRRQVFRRRDFGQRSDGEITLALETRRRVSEVAAPLLREASRSWVWRFEEAVALVARSAGATASFLPQKTGEGRPRRPGGIRTGVLTLWNRCEECGAAVPDTRRFCLRCAMRRQEERGAPARERPALQRSETMRERHRERRQWDERHTDEEAAALRGLWRDTLLPLLQAKSLDTIAAALRISSRTARRWRSGEVIPHPARIELVRQWLLASADDGHVPAPPPRPGPPGP